MFRPRNSNVPSRVRPGTIARASSPEQPRRLLTQPLSSLYDCISRGTIHMDKAAKLMLEKKKCHAFNQTAYDEFARSEVVNRAQKMVFDEIDNMDDDPVEEMRLNAIASRLQGDIIRAQIRKLARTLEMKDEGINQENLPKVFVENCTKAWKIYAQCPFVEVVFFTEVDYDYIREHRSHGVEQVAPAQKPDDVPTAYVHITDPRHKIQEYAVRVNNAGGRDEKLKDLPPEIEDVLIDFAQDALGYGHDELVPGYEGDLELSRKQRRGEKERTLAEDTRAVSMEAHLYHALQKALRDVRASKYKEIENSWTPSNKQKKKSMGVAEENNETTSNKQKRKAFVEVAEDNIEMVEDVTYLCL